MKKFFESIFKSGVSYTQRAANAADDIPRLTLKGSQKTLVIYKIEELVFKGKFEKLPHQMEDICEIVHYSAMHDEPIRVDYLQRLLPGVNFNHYNEQEYEEWLRYKHNLDSNNMEIIIDTQKSHESDPHFEKANQRHDQQINKNDFFNRRK